MNDFRPDDPVDVYDEDIRDWVPGVVESVSPSQINGFGVVVVVKTDKVLNGLSLKYVVSQQAAPQLLRRTR